MLLLSPCHLIVVYIVQLLTASADKTCALWDVEKLHPVFIFKGHSRDVLGLDTHPKEPFSVFASAVSVNMW